VYVSGKTSDAQSINVPHLDLEHEGGGVYLSDGVAGGDYIELKICLDCGQLLNFAPVTDEELKERFEEVQR
jgi:hypothetical protein